MIFELDCCAQTRDKMLHLPGSLPAEAGKNEPTLAGPDHPRAKFGIEDPHHAILASGWECAVCRLEYSTCTP